MQDKNIYIWASEMIGKLQIIACHKMLSKTFAHKRHTTHVRFNLESNLTKNYFRGRWYHFVLIEFLQAPHRYECVWIGDRACQGYLGGGELTTFNTSSVISWLSVLLVEETGVPMWKSPTWCKSLTNFITQCCVKYTSPCAGYSNSQL